MKNELQGDDMHQMTKGTMHGHMTGLFRGKANEDAYDFGWGPAWKWGFPIGAIIFLATSIGLLVVDSGLFVISGVFFLIALQLFAGFVAVRFIHHMDAELVLPYVNLVRSDRDQVLDVGCGSGRTSIAVGKVLGEGKIVAVDRFDADYIASGGKKLLERNLKIAKIAGKVDIQAQDATHMTFEDGRFDAAVSSYAIDHMGENKLKALQEINRVLKKDGRMLLMVMVPNYFTFMIFSVISRLGLISVGEWHRLFDQSGFRVATEGDINGGHFFLLEKIA